MRLPMLRLVTTSRFALSPPRNSSNPALAMLKRKLQGAPSADPEGSEGGPSRLRRPNAPGSPPVEKSKYFPSSTSTAEKFLDIQLQLNSALGALRFGPPVAYQYNPVEYAFRANESYVRRFCAGPKKLLFLGMNPGPFGMCQTGVPFGEVKLVRDWMGVCEEVGRPARECPSRPVLGFGCTRVEVSGDRFWGLFKRLCGGPDDFFRHAFVYNYCPLAFMKADGCNVTPSDMKDDKKQLEHICDQYYHKIIQLLHPEIVVGIGAYAEQRTVAVLKHHTLDFPVKALRLAHPSPRAVNNQNWPEKAEAFLKANDLLKYFQP